MIRKPIFLFFILTATAISPDSFDRFIIWNVGQGQWATWVQTKRCLHFDMGGEKFPMREVQRLCQWKTNVLYLSHSDIDHMKYVNWGTRHLPELCIMAWPRESLSLQKQRTLAQLPLCTKKLDDVVEIQFEAKRISDSNSLSRVYAARGPRWGTLLIPGDSTLQAEREWIPRLQALQLNNEIHGLLLGHHGSQTSTSGELLAALPRLKVAFCSSRKKRYGHPHLITILKLQKRHTPLLVTEHWGSLAFDF